ncbi:MAG: 1,6-anhydro-N-acetylmuramyl-L-alanine amidase AmpD [Magnetococcus sp. DMHC-6]
MPSPFCDERPSGVAVELLVVHAISLPPGCFGGTAIDDLFMGRLDPTRDPYFKQIVHLKVSSHFLVDRKGQLTQYVPVLHRAWHAGQSQWRGRTRCNDFSIGVELEGDAQTPFQPIQYWRLAGLFRTLQRRLTALADDHVVGHQEIAPDRKWDPGPCFDWNFFWTILKETGPEPHLEPIWE